MGPCWVEIKNLAMSEKNISWCKLELKLSNYTIDSVKVVRDSQMDSGLYPERCRQSPPLTVMSISMKTVMNYQKNVNEIVMASALVYNNVHTDGTTSEKDQQISAFNVVRQLGDYLFPMGFLDKCNAKGVKIEGVPTERALLNYFMGIFLVQSA